MAVLSISGAFGSGVVTLSAAQTGTGASTNVADRGPNYGPAQLTIVSTVGATPTVTVDIQGSIDNSDWYNVGYALPATPETPAVAALTITTATTGRYLLRANQPWRYLRLNLSANTNVTLTATVWAP